MQLMERDAKPYHGVSRARELQGQLFHSCRSGNNALPYTPCCLIMELCLVPIPELSGLAKAWTLKTDCCLSLSDYIRHVLQRSS